MEVWGCSFSVTTILPLNICFVELRVKIALGLYGILLVAFPVLRVRKGCKI